MHSCMASIYSTAAATCLVIRRWVFDPETELALFNDPVAMEFLYQNVRQRKSQGNWAHFDGNSLQAIENMNRGQIETEDKLYQLKALQEGGKKLEVGETKLNLRP